MKKFPAKIFYCYSHQDEELRDELEKHLKMLQRQNMITNWHDRKIIPGTDWNKEISRKLLSADVVLLLVSPDFLASEYCYEKEMIQALKLHAERKIRVIPILLRMCDWKSAPFGSIQSLPSDMIPVKDRRWHSLDDAFNNIREGIKLAIEEVFENEESETINYQEESYQTTNVRLKLNEKLVGASFDQQEMADVISNYLKEEVIIKSFDRTNKIILLTLTIAQAFKLQYAVKKREIKELKEIKFEYKQILEIEEGLFDIGELRNAVLCLRAVNHKLRQSIIKSLQDHQLMTITDIHVKNRLEISLVSQHLAILRRAGVVETM